jgi:hypothetical protein
MVFGQNRQTKERGGSCMFVVQIFSKLEFMSGSIQKPTKISPQILKVTMRVCIYIDLIVPNMDVYQESNKNVAIWKWN